MTGVAVKRLATGWGEAIVDLHRRAFSETAVELTILGSEGVSDYFESLLAFPEMQAEHLFLGAVEGGRLMGYAHFRRLPGSWHLNNVAVAPERVGAGVGTALLDGWTDQARRRGLLRLTLDVDPGNKRALEWYRRRGFVEAGRTWTFRCALTTEGVGTGVGVRPGIEILGWEGAVAWQRAYGFSSFDIRCEAETRRVGRLGERFFRVSGLAPRWLEPTLTYLDPARELLTILEKLGGEDVGRVVGESVRMGMALDD